ncbi:MAG: aldo/keto reductase [Gemmatimonadetes bacterium]|nr:aldo/keto reductase [Gemmatimonadota bacterium]
MKLALGTAQIGLDYGISNQRGQVSRAEAVEILKLARASSVTMLDTAVSYGDSEARLGDISASRGMDVVSKLPAIPDDVADIAGWMRDIVRGSLGRLRVTRLYGLLLHRSHALRGARAKEVGAALTGLMDAGLVLKTGVSIYVPAELDEIGGDAAVRLVQAPLNFFDDRLIQSGWLSRLKQKGIEVHARSIFLQGVLLFTPQNRPERFERWAEHFARYDGWMKTHDRSRLEVCVGYAMSVPEIDRIVVGVESAEQLTGIVAAAKLAPRPVPAALSATDPDLLDPLVWMRR